MLGRESAGNESRLCADLAFQSEFHGWRGPGERGRGREKKKEIGRLRRCLVDGCARVCRAA